MSLLISGSIQDVLSIKLKHRADSFTDQFSRIFMVKMLIISSLVTSMEFFSDTVSCIVPTSNENIEFVHSACWIQGFYIYEELRFRMGESGYYGMPKDVEYDGIESDGHLCRRYTLGLNGALIEQPECKPLTKIYFVHYQYFPFFIASLGILYYIPYILFRIINSDLISLKATVKESADDEETDRIKQCYFEYGSNGGVFVLRLRVLGTAGVKLIYVIVNLCGFIFTDHILDNRYYNYGVEWMKWSQLNNTFAFDYSGLRDYPKPGNYLLPSMGFCDIDEGSLDKRASLFNRYRIVCEISTHILYQYVLVVLWFLFIASIMISIFGFFSSCLSNISLALNCCMSFRRKKERNPLYRACENMTVREIEYMRFIREKNLPLYKDILTQIEREKMNSATTQTFNNVPMHNM